MTFVGDEECLPWTLSGVKWLWPGSQLCDLNHPFVWELEWSQTLLQGRFGLPCMSFRSPVRWVVSLLFGTAPSACIEKDCEQKSPSTCQCCRGHSPHQRLLRGTSGEIACRSSYQQPPCIHPEKLAYFLAYGHWILCRCGFSVWGRQGSNSQPRILTVQALMYEIPCSNLPFGFIILLS